MIHSVNLWLPYAHTEVNVTPTTHTLMHKPKYITGKVGGGRGQLGKKEERKEKGKEEK